MNAPLSRVRGTGTMARCAAWVLACALGVLAAAPAAAQSADRVLLNTTMTIGTYITDPTRNTDVDHWGYADSTQSLGDEQTASALGDATFTHGGVEYTVHRITATSGNTDGGFDFKADAFVIKDGGGTALPSTAAVGLEFATADAAVLLDWRRVGDDVADLDDPLEAHWKGNIGKPLFLRVLDLGENDIWSAELVTDDADDTSGLSGYGHADAGGSLTPTTFNLDGVDYTVDRLTVNSGTTAPGPYKLQFSTTPDLPVAAQVRLAVAGFASSGAPIADIVRYYPVTAAQASTATGIDFEWDLKGGRVNKLTAATTVDALAVYLTRAVAVTLTVAPAEVREGTAVELLVTATLAPPPAAATAVTLAFGADGDSAQAADYTAGALVLTIPAGSLSATGRVAFTAVDDAETEDAETVTVRGTTSDLPVIGATVTIPGNDYGTYLDATLTVGTVTITLVPAIGYLESRSVGSLAPRSFVCCVGASGGEAEYTVSGLFNRGSAFFIDGVNNEASPTDELVLHVGEDSRRLGSYEFAAAFPTLDSGREWLEDFLLPAVGETVPVRITGPKHAVVTDLSAVSTPRAMASGNSKLVYGPGDVLRLQVSYDEPVTVTGAPHLLFDVKNDHTDTTTHHQAAYVAADSTATQLVFGYTVDAMTAVSGNPVLLQDADTATDGVQPPLVLEAGEKIESVAVRTNRTASRWLPARELGTDHGLNNTATAVTAHTVALAGPARVSESGGTVEYSVRVDRTATAPVSVAWALTGTATVGEDYRGTVAGRVTIGTGSRAAKLSIAITDDHAVEPDETLTVTLYAPFGATLVSGRTAVTTTIADDDTPMVTLAAPAWQTATGHVFESEAHRFASTDRDGYWWLTRTGSLDEPLTVTVQPAASGFVASAAVETLTFKKDLAMVSYSPVTGDDVDEPHGMVTVTLLEGDGYDAMGRTAQSAMVRDDDGTLLTFAYDRDAMEVREGKKALANIVAETVRDGTFTEIGDLGRIFSVRRFPVNVSTEPGTATNDNDFSPTDVVVEFSPADFRLAEGGQGLVGRRAAVAVLAKTDTVSDAGEFFLLDLDHVDSGMGFRTPREVPVTITEGAALTLSVDDAELTEGETGTVTATVAPAQSAAFSVRVSVHSGTTQGRLELVGNNDVLRFAASETASTGLVQYRAVQNDIDEPDIDIAVFGTAADIPQGAVTVTIKDDDGPLVSIEAPTLHTATGHVFEHETSSTTHANAAGARWWLRRAGQTDAALAVKVRSSEAGGGDFVAAAKETTDDTVTFQIGRTRVSYSPVTNDTTDEPHGTVTVTVQDGTDYDVDAAAGAATASVRDDDGTTRMTITFHPTALSVPEGAPAQVYAQADTDATFTSLADFARLTFSVDRFLPVIVSMQHGTIKATGADLDVEQYRQTKQFRFADFKPAPGGTGMRHRVPAIVPTFADGVADPDEYFDLEFATAVGSEPALPAWAARGTANAARVTIREGPVVTLAVDDDELTEGETATVTATVDPTHATAFTVTVATDPASSTRYEFVGANRMLSFAANTAASTGVVQIKATPNDVDEADLDATLTATPSASAVSGGAGVAFTVVDDDLPTVSIAAPPLAGTGVDAHIFEFEAAKSYSGTLQPAQATELEKRAAWQLTRVGVTDEELEVSVIRFRERRRLRGRGGRDHAHGDVRGGRGHGDLQDRHRRRGRRGARHGDGHRADRHGLRGVDNRRRRPRWRCATTTACCCGSTWSRSTGRCWRATPARSTRWLTTIDAGLQAGTLTAKADIGRALRYRDGFLARARRGPRSGSRWIADSCRGCRECRLYTIVNRYKVAFHQVADFVTKGTAFELRKPRCRHW